MTAARPADVSRRELFGALCGMVFLVNGARLVFAPLIQPVAAEFEVTAASLGIVASAAWLGSAAPRIPAGLLLTRLPRHYLIVFTGSLLVGTSIFTGLAGSVTHLTVGAFLMGMSSGMYFIAANPLISELFPDRVGRAIGVHGMSNQLAAVTAPVALSLILLVGNWRVIFGCIAVAATIGTGILYWATRRTELPEAGAADRSLLVAARAQWPLVLTGITIIGAIGFLWNGLFNLYGDYLEIVKGIDPGTGRLLLSSMFAAGIPAFFVSGRLADRLPNVPLFLGIATAFATSVFALTIVEGFVPIVVCSLLVGYCMYSIVPVVDTYMLSTLPDRHRGSAYSLYSAGMMLVQSLGSGTIGTVVVAGVSYTRAFRIVSLLVLGVITVLFVTYRAGFVPHGSRASMP